MLRKLYTLLALLFSFTVFGQDFSSIWTTSEAGTSADNQITIPTNPAYTYDYSVDWGDGTTDTNVTGNITHTYASQGTYTVNINGDFPAIYFNNAGDRRKIIEILSWGDIVWQSMEDAFHGCQNLNFDAIDAPDLSNVTSLRDMFRRCSSFNGIVNNWDVSNVTDISGIFAQAITFNRPLDNWTTNAITDMSFVFEGAQLFNEPLDNWNTANVENMEGMFYGANQFDQDINNWVVTQVTNMSQTFRNTSSFNRPLNNWNVSNVTNMSQMFSSSGFNQNIAVWNVSAVTNMSAMFNSAAFNQPLEQWDVSSVTDMSAMFRTNRAFNQPLNNWNVGNVVNMDSMFRGSGAFPTVFNQPLNLWNVSKVENMSRMFEVAEFNQPINDWNVSSVTDMSNMFSGFSTFLYDFNQPLDQWDVSNVTNMSGMFQSSRFNQPIGNWNVANVENMSRMFSRAVNFNQPIDSWVLTSLNNTSSMFQNAFVFNQPLNSWTMDNVTTMQNMFANALLFNQPLNNWDTDSVTDMRSMFTGALAFNQSLADWNIGQVTSMINMLNDTALTLENYDLTLIGWAGQTVNDNVNLGVNGLTYCDGRDARQELIDDSSWNISGDSVDCSFVLCTTFSSPQDGDTNVPANFDLRWNPAPNADGYNVSVSYVRAGVTTVVLDDSDEGNVVGLDFTTDFMPGDVVTALVVPYNDEGPATGCEEITFTVVPNWRDGTDAFKFTIDTNVDRSGYSNTNQLRINARPGVAYNYSIDWGDNQFDNNVTETITHTYLNPGVYTIAIIGDYPAHYYPNPSSDNNKLLTIDQWGTIAWETLESGFYSCGGFTGYNATDTPDLSRVTDISRMFESSNFNGNINDWDVSTIENMARTFIGMSVFNQPLNDWEVGNVTDMSDMFLGTTQFNQPLNNWDVSNVVSMRRMFDGFNRDMSFNQNLNDWDVSSVTNMTSMFSKCVDFDQPLNDWVPSSVTTMAEMFDGAITFNQDISNWDVSSVTDMSAMFFNATAFNQNIDNWNVSAVQNMSAMFQNAISFNQPLNQWDVNNVLNMSSMFENAVSFNQPIGNWDVNKATNMPAMFRDATAFNQNIDSWNVTSVINMSSMFEGALNFNSPLNNWNVNSVVTMSSMFKDAIAFDQPIGLWNVSAVANMSEMFQNATLFNQDIQNWDVSSVTIMNSMFENAIAFASPMENWQVGSVTRMDSMFKNAVAFNSPINNWDTGEVLTMQEMFSGASAFDQNIDNWNVSFVTTMEEMFKDATSYNQSMDSWNVASVRTMKGMFQGASAFDGSIGSWNVRGVTTMQDMFNTASSFNQELSNWRVAAVTNMNNMFQNASSYNQHMDGWILGNASMQNFLLDATSFNQSLAEWDVSGITDMGNMLDNTAIERLNYDATLVAWSELTLTPGITFGALTLPYCDALEERQSIMDNYGWNIVGDVLDCPLPECVVLTSPLNGAIDVPVNTNITWAPALYARGYRLTVGTTPGGNDVVDDETINDQTSYEFATDFNFADTVYVTLIPFNDEGDAVGPCTEESFTISSSPATIPECTNLTEPLNNAIDVALNSDLNWNPISNADGYRLTVGTTPGGNELVANEDVGNTTTYEFAGNLPEDSTVFVTITPYNDEGEAVNCGEESFKTELIPVAPICTNLISPTNNATDVAITTDLSWAAVPEATGYLVTVGTTSGGIEIANNIDVGNFTTYNFVDDLQENRTFYVTIIPYNEVGDATGCVEESFTTETLATIPNCTALTSPLNGSTNVSIATDLTWTALTNADGYFVTVGTTSGGNDILDNEDVTGTTFDLPTDLPEDTEIFVTIVPYNGLGNATGCTEESFTTETLATIPNCTALTAPLSGSTDVSIITDLTWTAIANADGYFVTVGTTSGGNDILDSEDVTGTTFNLPTDLPENTEIFVTIVPYNGVGNATGCSEESFTTETLATIPNCTALTSPLNGSTDVSIITDLTWTAIANADGYFVTVGTTSGGNDILDSEDVIGTTFDLPTDLPENTEIFVTIVPYNGLGNATGCSEESFTTETTGSLPDCTSLSMALTNAATVSVSSDLTWDAANGADGYRLTVGTNSGGNDILDNFDVANALTYDLPNDLPFEQEVFVTITPYNNLGDALGCLEQSFTTATEPMPPACTNLLSPLNLDIDVSVSAILSWNPVPEADGYRLTVGTAAGLGDIVNNEDIGNLTSFNLTNDLPENTEIFVSIVPYNAIGNAEFCEEESFITETLAPETPPCTTITGPENGSTDVPVNTNITWNAIGDVDGYIISIGTSVGGTDIVDNEDLGLATSYELQDLSFEQEIFVSVLPYNSEGTAVDCGVHSFTTIAEPEVESLYGFSPDNDGINDFWVIEGIEQYPDNTVLIYNRWGDMVFKIDGYDNSANVFRGEANQMTGFGAGQLPEGTYFFNLILPEDHNLKQTKGYLVLKR